MKLEQKLYALGKQTKQLKLLRSALNEILANSVYSDREYDSQIRKLSKAGAKKEDIDLVTRAWGCRKIIVEDNKRLLEEVIRDVEKQRRNRL